MTVGHTALVWQALAASGLFASTLSSWGLCTASTATLVKLWAMASTSSFVSAPAALPLQSLVLSLVAWMGTWVTASHDRAQPCRARVVDHAVCVGTFFALTFLLWHGRVGSPPPAPEVHVTFECLRSRHPDLTLQTEPERCLLSPVLCCLLCPQWEDP